MLGSVKRACDNIEDVWNALASIVCGKNAPSDAEKQVISRLVAAAVVSAQLENLANNADCWP